MAIIRAIILALAAALGAKGVWTPNNAVKELDAIEAALRKVANSPLLTSAQLATAKQVVEDVERANAAMQAGKNMTKEKKRQTIAGAIKALQSLQAQWSLAASGNKTAMSQKLHVLQKELAAKQLLLNKTQSLLKLARLQKELAEKKLQMQGLLDAKARAEATEADAERAREQAAAAKLVATAHTLAVRAGLAAKARAHTANASRAKPAAKAQAKAGNATRLPAPVQVILSKLREQARNVSSAIDREAKAEKKREAEADRIIKAQVPSKGSTDATRQGQMLLKSLSKKAARTYRKHKAAMEAQLVELNEGIRGVESGDVAALKKLMAKMQHEADKLKSQSNGFLH